MKIRDKAEILVQDTIDIYKDNFRLLTLLSLIGASISFIYQMIVGFFDLSETITLIIVIIVSIPVYYYLFRFKIALIIVIHYKYHKKDISIGKSYALSSNWFWNYFLTNLKFALLIAAPMILLVLIISANVPILIRIGSAVILGAIIFYLVVYYGFASLASILKSDSKNYFNTSKKIVSSDLVFTIVMILIGLVCGLILHYTKEFLYRGLMLHSGLVQNFINLLFSVFTTPILLGAYVLLFYRLVENDINLNGEDVNTLPNTM